MIDGAYMIVFRLDAGPIVVEIGNREEIGRRYDDLSPGWSEVYMCRVERGPRDVVDQIENPRRDGPVRLR